jgi:hypothetical protein
MSGSRTAIDPPTLIQSTSVPIGRVAHRVANASSGRELRHWRAPTPMSRWLREQSAVCAAAAPTKRRRSRPTSPIQWRASWSNDHFAQRPHRARSTRVAAFIVANPSWPSLAMFRRRAEAMLWGAEGKLRHESGGPLLRRRLLQVDRSRTQRTWGGRRSRAPLSRYFLR